MKMPLIAGAALVAAGLTFAPNLLPITPSSNCISGWIM